VPAATHLGEKPRNPLIGSLDALRLTVCRSTVEPRPAPCNNGGFEFTGRRGCAAGAADHESACLKVAMNVLIVEDHVLLLQSLEGNVLSIRPNATVRGSRSVADADHELCRGGTPDHILLDLGLPDAEGFEALTHFREVAPNAAIAVVSGHSDVELIRACFKHGASAYIEKSRYPDQFLRSLRSFLERGYFIPSVVADSVNPATFAAATAGRP